MSNSHDTAPAGALHVSRFSDAHWFPAADCDAERRAADVRLIEARRGGQLAAARRGFGRMLMPGMSCPDF